jgi:hypothetical protein
MKTKFFYSMILVLGLIFAGSGISFMNGQSTTKSTTEKTTTKTSTKVAPVKYICKMHPEVVMNKPGKCPKCGMALVEKKDMQKGKMMMKKETMKEKTTKETAKPM